LYDAEGEKKSLGDVVAGNMMFFFNCLGSSMYVVASKPLLKSFPPISVTGLPPFPLLQQFHLTSFVLDVTTLLFFFSFFFLAGFSYIIASVFMGIACVIVNSSQTLLTFVCPPEDGSDEKDSCGNGWHIPAGAIWALAYWVSTCVLNSIYLLFWP
jgi:hypothetical protein